MHIYSIIDTRLDELAKVAHDGIIACTAFAMHRWDDIRFSTMHAHLLTKLYNKLPFNIIAWLCAHMSQKVSVCNKLYNHTRLKQKKYIYKILVSRLKRLFFSALTTYMHLNGSGGKWSIQFINWISLSCEYFESFGFAIDRLCPLSSEQSFQNPFSKLYVECAPI